MKSALVLTLMLSSVLVSGCATNPAFRDDCDWAKPIHPSRADVLSGSTARQILAHNEAGSKLCGWKP